MGNGKEGHVLNIRVVFRGIGDDVMNVVASFPPAQAEASQIVRNDNPDHTIDLVVVSDSYMTCIVSSKHELMPETAEEKCRSPIPAPSKEYIK